MNLKTETIASIDAVVPKYPQKRSAVLPVLHRVQADQGFISNDAIEWVADRLEIEPINVYEVVTFYPHFRQKPIGKRHIRLCRTLSCALMGSYNVAETLKEEFKCGMNEVSPDGEVTIEFVECLASCGTGPVLLLDDDLYENVTEARAREIAQQIRDEAAARDVDTPPTPAT